MGDYNSEELQEASISHLFSLQPRPKHSLITVECGSLHVCLTDSESICTLMLFLQNHMREVPEILSIFLVVQ